MWKGWSEGRLTFEYPNPYSLAREQFIMRQIEKDLLRDLMHVRANVVSSLASGATGNKKAPEAAFEVLEHYTELTLPYIHNKNKMKVDVYKNPDSWQAMLAEKKRQLAEEKNKEQNPEE